MSLQGQGAGISGTSNQFQVGYSQGAGYGYGNAAGYAPQAGYANQSSAAVQTLQLTSTQGNSNWGWQGQQSNPSHLWGSNQGTVNTVFNPAALQVSYAGYSGSAGNINAYAAQAGYANQSSASTQNLQLVSASSSTWAWSGQQSNPAWLWGSNQGTVNTVFSPGALQVGYAGYAGSTGNVNGYAPQCGYANVGGNITGYVPQCGYANQSATTSQTLQIRSSGTSSFYWSGQGGVPGHYWGSNDGYNNYVWNTGQMYAGYAGSTTNWNQSAGSVTYAQQATVPQYAQTISGAAQTGGDTTSIQGQVGICRGWRGNANGASSGISQYQGGSYGQIALVLSSSGYAYNCSFPTYSNQFYVSGNYVAFQQVGPGISFVQ